MKSLFFFVVNIYLKFILMVFMLTLCFDKKVYYFEAFKYLWIKVSAKCSLMSQILVTVNLGKSKQEVFELSRSTSYSYEVM